MTEDGNYENKDFVEAIERIGRTPDGHLLYLHLQRQLTGVVTDATARRALPMNEGRRIFAAELMAMLAKGIVESGGSTRDRPIVIARREPIAVSRHVRARDYLAANPDYDPTDRRGDG